MSFANMQHNPIFRGMTSCYRLALEVHTSFSIRVHMTQIKWRQNKRSHRETADVTESSRLLILHNNYRSTEEVGKQLAAVAIPRERTVLRCVSPTDSSLSLTLLQRRTTTVPGFVWGLVSMESRGTRIGRSLSAFLFIRDLAFMEVKCKRIT